MARFLLRASPDATGGALIPVLRQRAAEKALRKPCGVHAELASRMSTLVDEDETSLRNAYVVPRLTGSPQRRPKPSPVSPEG